MSEKYNEKDHAKAAVGYLKQYEEGEVGYYPEANVGKVDGEIVLTIDAGVLAFYISEEGVRLVADHRIVNIEFGDIEFIDSEENKEDNNE